MGTTKYEARKCEKEIQMVARLRMANISHTDDYKLSTHI